MQPSKRKIITRAPARTVRILNLPGLLPGPVAAESSFEAHFVLRAALLPTCKTIAAQPFTVAASPKGYTPDYLQTYTVATASPSVVEIKPRDKLKKYMALFDHAAELLAGHGYQFYVITDRELFTDKIESRVQLIRRYAKADIAPIQLRRIKHVLSDHPRGIPIGSLIRKAAVSREAILHYMACRLLTVGPKLKIDDAAVVRLNAVDSAEQTYSFGQWFGVAPWGRTPEADVA